jgi:hypothetical protein
MEPGKAQQPTPAGTLLVTRIIWAALLMGQVIFLVIVLTIGPGFAEPDPELMQILLYVLFAMLVTMVPIAYVVRGVIYNKGRRDGVQPQAYATGNILFLAMCEGVGFAGLTFALLNRGGGPHLIVALIAMAVQVINFPTGRAMRGDDAIQPMHRR